MLIKDSKLGSMLIKNLKKFSDLNLKNQLFDLMRYKNVEFKFKFFFAIIE